MQQLMASTPGSSSAQSLLAQDAYHNVSQLQKLANPESAAGGASLDAISRQFESLLVHQMLKSMRSANRIWSEDSLLNSSRVDFYQQMLDDQLSVSLTNDSGLGFAEQIRQQLGAQVDPEVKPVDETGDSTNIAAVDIRRFGGPAQYPSASSARTAAMETEPQAAVTQQPAQPLPADSDEFIEQLLPHAERAASQLGVPTEQILAQAALETGWGKHVLSNADGSSSYNLFGIKADSRWSGASVSSMTREFFDQRELQVRASFRSYDSLQQAFDDYVDFLTTNPRYANALQSGEAFGRGLQQAGYATDPLYASKIERIAAQLPVASPAGELQ